MTRLRQTSTLFAVLIAGTLSAAVVSSCGSGGSGTVAEQVRAAASTATTTTQRSKTATAPATPTVTQPAKTVTAPAKTVTSPGTVTTVTEQTPTNSVTSVQVNPTTTTAEQSSDGGLEWWGWALIALAVVGLGAGLFALGRHRRGGSPPPGAPRPPRPPRAPDM